MTYICSTSEPVTVIFTYQARSVLVTRPPSLSAAIVKARDLYPSLTLRDEVKLQTLGWS